MTWSVASHAGCAPADGTTRVPPGGSSHAATAHAVHARAAGFTDINDHIVRVLERDGWHRLGRGGQGQGKGSRNQPDHRISPCLESLQTPHDKRRAEIWYEQLGLALKMTRGFLGKRRCCGCKPSLRSPSGRPCAVGTLFGPREPSDCRVGPSLLRCFLSLLRIRLRLHDVGQAVGCSAKRCPGVDRSETRCTFPRSHHG
jgi:hypothetical protein